MSIQTKTSNMDSLTIGNYKFKVMADQPKSITVSMNTLVPVSLVVVLLSYGVYQEARLKNMENQIHINTTENVRTQADIKEVKSNYVTIKEFTLTLENLNTKLDAIKKAVEK